MTSTEHLCILKEDNIIRYNGDDENRKEIRPVNTKNSFRWFRDEDIQKLNAITEKWMNAVIAASKATVLQNTWSEGTNAVQNNSSVTLKNISL